MCTRTRAKVRRCVCAYCGEHNTSVTGPDHPAHIVSRRCPTTTAVPSAWAMAMEIVRRGRVLPSLLHGSQTQVSRVPFMPVDPTSYTNILPRYVLCTYVEYCLHRGRLRTSLPIFPHSHPVRIKRIQYPVAGYPKSVMTSKDVLQEIENPTSSAQIYYMKYT